MMFPRLAVLAAILLVSFVTETSAQGPFRRFGHALVEHRPVRTAIASRPVATVVKTIVQEKPVRSVVKATYQSVASKGSSTNYGSQGTSYGSQGTSYGSTSYSSTNYGSQGTSYSSTNYGSQGTSYSSTKYSVSCPCGPNCQCDVGGTPCPCPKTQVNSPTEAPVVECKDCKIVGTEPPTVGAKDEPMEFSGTEATDSFHRSFVVALTEARKEGKISRINALALRGAMHLPSFQAKVKDTVVAEAKKTGMISVSATPEDVGKIDWSKIDWVTLIKTLLPIILSLL